MGWQGLRLDIVTPFFIANGWERSGVHAEGLLQAAGALEVALGPLSLGPVAEAARGPRFEHGPAEA